MARSHPEPARLKIRGRHRSGVVAQAAANRIPRLGGFEGICGARENLDLHLRDDGKPLVRAIVFEARDRVAEGVEILARRAGLRVERERMFETALERELAGLQVQQMMRVRHVAAVFVHRCMTYRVACHADTARKSKSMCEKCCEVSWSES